MTPAFKCCGKEAYVGAWSLETWKEEKYNINGKLM